MIMSKFIILQKIFKRTFFVLFLGLGTMSLFGQNVYTLNVGNAYANGTITGSGGVTFNSAASGGYPANVFVIPASSTYNYVFTGTTSGTGTNSRRIIIQSGYKGTITLQNLSMTSAATNTPSAANTFGLSGYSCITVEGAYNQSNLNPVTKVNFILSGTNTLTYSTTNYCALQVNQGAQIQISAIDSTNNASGTLTAHSTNTGGGAGIGAPNFATPSGTLPGRLTSNIGQGTDTSSCMPLNGGTTGTAHTSTTAGGNIIISSGTVSAQGGHAAGIGGGFRTYYNGIVIIYGGIVNAVGSNHSAGIGSGCPVGTGVITCFATNSMIVALPPAQITATGAGTGSSGPTAQFGLAGSRNITYIGDPNKPLITVHTEDTTPNANIYLDLTLTPNLVPVFDSIGMGWYDLTKVRVGRTDAVTGMLSFRAEFQQNTTFFTDASSIKPATLGRPFMPVTRTVFAATTVILPLLQMDISLVDYPSTPLQLGYTSTEAGQNAYRLKVIYNDANPMTNITYSMQNGTDFPSLLFYASDGVTPILPPQTLNPLDTFFIAIPIDIGKPIGIYSDVLQIIGVWKGVSLPGPIRKVALQRVVYDDSHTNTYIKVTASPNRFLRIYPTSDSTILTLNISHGTLSVLYDPTDVFAKYLITTEPDYALVIAANPINTWSSLNIPAADSVNRTTTVSFTGKTQGTYYIHWYVESGVVYAHSLTVVSPPALYGGFGAYLIVDTVVPGTISGATICDGSQAVLTGTASTGGLGTYTYAWQSGTSATGPWTNLPSSNSQNYTTANLAVGTYYYRRLTIDDSLGTSYSNVLAILVSPIADSTYIITNDTVYACYNTSPTMTVSSTLVTNPRYRWYDTQNSTTVLHTGSSYTPSTPLTSSRSYFVSVDNVSGTVCENSSGNRKEIRVVVYFPLTAGVVAGSHDICTTSVPAILREITPKTGGSNLISYQWQSSSDSLNWSNITGETSTDYSPNALAATTFFRRVDTDLQCGDIVPTNGIKITVYNFPILNTEITGTNTVCDGSSIQLNNATSGGVWTVNNTNATISNPNATPVTITGTAVGNTYVTYTITNGPCESKKTFSLKIIPAATAPGIKIGFE